MKNAEMSGTFNMHVTKRNQCKIVVGQIEGRNILRKRGHKSGFTMNMISEGQGEMCRLMHLPQRNVRGQDKMDFRVPRNAKN
jgi:hypothetical protein